MAVDPSLRKLVAKAATCRAATWTAAGAMLLDVYAHTIGEYRTAKARLVTGQVVDTLGARGAA